MRVNLGALVVFAPLLIITVFVFVAIVALEGVLDIGSIGAGAVTLLVVVRIARVRAVVHADRVEFRNLVRSGSVPSGARVRERFTWWGFQQKTPQYQRADGLWVSAEVLMCCSDGGTEAIRRVLARR